MPDSYLAVLAITSADDRGPAWQPVLASVRAGLPVAVDHRVVRR